jgi:hypothetical protein
MMSTTTQKPAADPGVQLTGRFHRMVDALKLNGVQAIYGSRRSRHRTQLAWPTRLLLGTVALLVPALAGCEAGFNAPTLHFHPTAPGATVTTPGRAARLRLRDLLSAGHPADAYAGGEGHRHPEGTRVRQSLGLGVRVAGGLWCR